MPERITVIGLTGAGGLDKGAVEAIEDADLLIGSRPRLEALEARSRRAGFEGGLAATMDAIAREPGRVCVLASGDPGFFGIVRPLAERFGTEILEVHPAPSSVSLAFSRLRLPWDDASVVSAHGRPLEDAARAAARRTKVAVLMSPESPPEALGAKLLELGADFSHVSVCERLGAPDESVTTVDLDALASGRWDPMSVVVLIRGSGLPASPVLEWGLPDDSFGHRAGMITKAEVRAIALGKLSLPATGVMWDLGAGSGSVSIECARMCPELEVIAVEKAADQALLVQANADHHGVSVRVVPERAPAALAELPDPDRVFVGGGGMPVLDAARRRLKPGGRIVATYAALDRAAGAAKRLGNVVEIGVARGQPLAGDAIRLRSENPVFVAWGPDDRCTNTDTHDVR